MKAASAIIKAPRFPVEWTDDPDNDPPPGKPLAQALLDDLLRSGRAHDREKTIGNHSYEHSSWHFGFELGDAGFWVNLEGHPDSVRQPATWLITIEKERGLFAALFGRSGEAYDVPDHCRDFVQESICRVFGVERVQWREYDEAYGAFLSNWDDI